MNEFYLALLRRDLNRPGGVVNLLHLWQTRRFNNLLKHLTEQELADAKMQLFQSTMNVPGAMLTAVPIWIEGDARPRAEVERVVRSVIEQENPSLRVHRCHAYALKDLLHPRVEVVQSEQFAGAACLLVWASNRPQLRPRVLEGLQVAEARTLPEVPRACEEMALAFAARCCISDWPSGEPELVSVDEKEMVLEGLIDSRPARVRLKARYGANLQQMADRLFAARPSEQSADEAAVAMAA